MVCDVLMLVDGGTWHRNRNQFVFRLWPSTVFAAVVRLSDAMQLAMPPDVRHSPLLLSSAVC